MIDGQQAEVGSSTSFDDFYAQQWPYAFRLAALMTHDAEAGADIAQDVFAKMLSALGDDRTTGCVPPARADQRQYELATQRSDRRP